FLRLDVLLKSAAAAALPSQSLSTSICKSITVTHRIANTRKSSVDELANPRFAARFARLCSGALVMGIIFAVLIAIMWHEDATAQFQYYSRTFGAPRWVTVEPRSHGIVQITDLAGELTQEIGRA